MVTVVTMVADRVKSGYHGCRELRVVTMVTVVTMVVES